MSDPTHIIVRNARAHNLQHVDIDVPRNALVVFTGVSGSGKSSLVFDTIYKEGQRRFMESLSAYARQFLGQMERPEVDLVEGISPTLSIDQKTVNRNPRSTVGTITEVYDHLRLLLARLGTPHCPTCDKVIDQLGVSKLVDIILESGEGRKVQILGPVVVERKGEYRKELEELARDGWVRARIDGELMRIDEAPALERYKKHTIEVVVDRLKPRTSDRSRLTEAVETALALGDQVVTVLIDDKAHRYATRRACLDHPEQTIPELEPRLFSFNSPQGACEHCQGLGELQQFELDRIVDMSQRLDQALSCLNEEGRLPFSRLGQPQLRGIAKDLGADIRKPLRSWSRRQLDGFLYGNQDVTWLRPSKFGPARPKRWDGLMPTLDQIWHYTKHKGLVKYRSHQVCPACNGSRLSEIARAVRFRERGIHHLSSMTVAEAHAFFEQVVLEGDEIAVGKLLVQEIRDRLGFLVDVGLGYLSLTRSAATLSGGESQRIRLASQVGSGLQGVTYVLDEPSIGLHPRDNQRLLGAIKRLRDRGNSVLVVEHDAETILAADYVVDVGPGAGREGGCVTAAGTPGEFLHSDCLTARYLRGDLEIAIPGARRAGHGTKLVFRGASANNLDSLDVEVPLGVMVVVTGVSGSGKSSLVFQVMEPSITQAIRGEGGPVGCVAVEGIEHIDKVIRISQRPIGRTPRSNPATYTGAMDLIRDLFAATPEARARGYTKSRFSFNVEGGRCEDCQGAGVKTIEMQFLPDVEVPCESCDSQRFNRETLDVRFKGRHIAEVLALTIGEALEFFANQPKLARILQTLVDVGLSYVSLGQSSTTLSGGEAQRIKLASELHRPSTGRTLYLLDEPTTGLHMHDVAKLIVALDRLVELGNTVLIVEHHTDVIKRADHILDLGPEGGDGGGRLVAQGPPELVAGMATATGRALSELTRLGGALPVPAVASSSQIAHASSRPAHIAVRGAEKHNLQHVDVDVPHGQLTVITGPSGSGKTSLAFDTIFAEGQRRYVESLSTYARRFLGRMDRAPVDLLEGLQPAIAIDQGSSSHNPRSTVATVTEVHDVLRLLYARVGCPHCPTCHTPLTASSPSSAARALQSAAEDTGWIVTRLPADAEPEMRRELLVRDGWRRLLVMQEQPEQVDLEQDLEQAHALLRRGAHLVVDRLRPARAARERLAEAIGHAYQLGDGLASFVPRGEGEVLTYTRGLVCPTHGAIAAELTPRHFSFNSRLGMCVACEGLGTREQVDPARLFVGRGPLWDALDPRVSALVKKHAEVRATLEAIVRRHGQAESDPISCWPESLMDEVMFGCDAPVEVTWSHRRRRQTGMRRWHGLLTLLLHANVAHSWLGAKVPCSACGGGRLGPVMLSVTLGGKNIAAFSEQTVEEALQDARSWSLSREHEIIAARARLELERRLGFLVDVGLGYLGLARRASSLSGGESQRIRLASQLGAGLTGVTYVLDEPTVGLHPADTERLLGTLTGLRDQGNTVLVVEHDVDTIERADHIIDMGPAAGRFGGQLIAQGPPDQIRADPESVTGPWLAGLQMVEPWDVSDRKASGQLVLEGARTHNLKGETLRLTLGSWVAVTGVSGSGKSSLIMDTLVPALKLQLGLDASPGAFTKLHVDGTIDGLVVIDQTPLGRTPRSTPATYIKVMDKLRKLYSQTLGAQERGWKPGRFSFNAKGGRCEECEGRGAKLIEMHFLPDVWVTCQSCHGHRFGRETLGVRWKGHSIADVLAMRADEAAELFSAHRGIHRSLQALVDVGLGYMNLGQPSTTLSGGEAQRVKLAAELVARRGKRLYVLDEPTTGLHMSDVSRLISVLHRLVDAGHTVITIEHNLDMIEAADQVVELGPAGGAAGGHIVASGSVEQIRQGETPTGLALNRARERLAAAAASRRTSA